MNSNNAEIEASQWLARLDKGDATAADCAEFEQWKTLDARHGAAFARLEAAWQALDRIQAVRPGGGVPIDPDYLRAAMPPLPAIHTAATDSAGPPYARRSRLAWSVAASLLVAIGGIWLAHTVGGRQSFSTGVGGFQRIVLKDQSAIDLNTDSEVRVVLTPRMRKVELVRGEASFEVAHDASRPFVVSAGDTAVRAVGTKFDVRRLDNAVEVIVDEGKVLVGAPEVLETLRGAPPSTMLGLSAGQTALSSGGGVKLSDLPKGSVARKLAWQNQMLVFDGDSLADVVAQFNRYNERQLVIADTGLTRLQIGGYFRPTNLDAFISVLQADFGIRVNVDGNRLVLATATAH